MVTSHGAKKWEIDDIIAPEARKDAENFTCSVCLGIWSDPYQTPCDHIFCKACVLGGATCPLCRANIPVNGLKPVEKFNKVVMRMLNSLQVICPYSKELPSGHASQAGTTAGAKEGSSASSSDCSAQPRQAANCAWTGSYADLKRHLDSCQMCVVPCLHGCGKEMRRLDLATHARVCERNLVLCNICGEEVRAAGLEEHNKDQAERHVQVLQQMINPKPCPVPLFSPVPISPLLAELQFLRQQVQNLKRTQVMMMQQLHAFGKTPSTVWEIPAADLADCPKGNFISSSYFELGGLWFRLVLYPLGTAESTDGFFSLYLERAADESEDYEESEGSNEPDESEESEGSFYDLKCTMTAAGQTSQFDFTLGPGGYCGRPVFGPVASLPWEGVFEVEVKILSAVERVW